MAEGGLGPETREGDLGGSCFGEVVSAARRRACVEYVKREVGVAERKACAVLAQHRSTQGKVVCAPDDEDALTADIVELAKCYGRYGYWRLTALPRTASWAMKCKRVQRIRRCEGLAESDTSATIACQTPAALWHSATAEWHERVPWRWGFGVGLGGDARGDERVSLGISRGYVRRRQHLTLWSNATETVAAWGSGSFIPGRCTCVRCLSLQRSVNVYPAYLCPQAAGSAGRRWQLGVQVDDEQAYPRSGADDRRGQDSPWGHHQSPAAFGG